jgi:hypothetical protein
MIKRILALSLLCCSTMLFTACETISLFDSTAAQKATELKASALALMDQASGSYATHRSEAETVKLLATTAYDYAKSRSKNQESIQQWAILVDPNRNSLVGFIDRWEKEGKLSQVFVHEAKAEFAKAMDAIIDLETGKKSTP